MARQSLSIEIADHLRREILRGVLVPGGPIKERVLAEEMQVSRTPMREAIRMLAKEGLVELRPDRSPVVADPSFAEIADQIVVLKTLEVLSGELACTSATDREVAAIRRLHERIAAEFDALDTLELFEIDMQFHIAVAHASHNAVLAETHAAFLARLWRARYLSARQKRSRDRVVRQHGAIVTGLERRDPGLVKTEIEAHLDALLDNIRDCFEGRAEIPAPHPAADAGERRPGAG